LNGFVTVIGMDSYPISPDPGLRNETGLGAGVAKSSAETVAGADGEANCSR
jgi:hypothetical protein